LFLGTDVDEDEVNEEPDPVHDYELGGNFDAGDDLGDGEADAEDAFSGGRFSSSQVSEIHAIVAKMHDEIEDKAKQWKRSTESLLRVGNVLIRTKERRSGGNPWNAFHNAFEKDPTEDRPHHEYVRDVVRPAYLKLIEEHGGQNSAEWKAKAKQLIEDHSSLKAAGAAAIAQTPSDLGKVMNQLSARWEDDLKWGATMNIHGMFILVSGIPDAAASKHNVMVCGSKAMHQWATTNLPVEDALLPLIHSSILMATGQPVMLPKRLQPKDMHKMRKEVSDEILRLVLACGVKISRVPWRNLPSFLATHHLKFENWPSVSEFPSVQDLAVDQVRTESWKMLWEAFFDKKDSKRVMVSSLSDVSSANEGRLPGTTVLLSDYYGRTLVSVADTQKDHPDDPNSSPPSPGQSHFSAAGTSTSLAGPSPNSDSQAMGSIPTLDLSSISKKRNLQPHPHGGRKRTKKSTKSGVPYKSAEFILDDNDADEPQVDDMGTAVTLQTLSTPTEHLPTPLATGLEPMDFGIFPALPPLPDDVLDRLSTIDWTGEAGIDPLFPHLQNWDDMSPLGYPSS
jgi:hypothetical protein